MAFSVTNFFCLAIMLFLLYRAIVDKNVMKTHKKLLLFALISEASLYFFDAIGNLMSVGAIPSFRVINCLVHMMYFVALATTCHGAFLLLEALDESPLYYNRKLRILFSSVGVLLAICAFISVILSLCNSSFTLIFYIDEAGKYYRGQFNWLQMVTSLTYLLIVLIHGIVGIINNKNYARRKTYINMIIFVLAPTVTGILQVTAMPDYPMLALGVTFSTLVLYFHLVQNQILTDGMTGVNNKNSLYKYLQTANKIENLVVFMLDLDSFKEINDTYGHIEGDNAIVLFANALKNFANQTDYFVARYGGDEFVLAGHTPENMLYDIIRILEQSIKHMNDISNKQYEIKASFGYAYYNDSFNNSQELINAADRVLYEKKKESKISR